MSSASPTVAGPPQRKTCVLCGADLAGAKHFTDASGHCYCEACAANLVPAAAAAAPGTIAGPDRGTARAYGLAPAVTCPHCWLSFPPERVLWVSQHGELLGDPVLGPEQPRRFLPSRFTPEGQAIDARGMPCQLLACPRCHLIVPRSVLEIEPLFLSIIGGPRSGKSYFLTAMTWELRRRLPSEFALTFNDADTVSNRSLNEYEAALFLPDDPDRLVAIHKTDLQGELYDQAALGGRVVSLPRPFLFNLHPSPRHPLAGRRHQVSRVLCMYDNAGEHFQPGMDAGGSLATQHLAKSGALMFLFDPTQDARLREKCRGVSADPQVAGGGTQRQETLLIEAALRVRRYANVPAHARHPQPLIVVVPKSDVWAPLLAGEDLVAEPVLPGAVGGGTIAAVDALRVERVSEKLREFLLRWTPEVVAAAEDFCQHVVYVPVSALGCSPELAPLGDVSGGNGSGSALLVRPKDIAPRWAAVPMLYLFAKWTTGLILGNSPAPAK